MTIWKNVIQNNEQGLSKGSSRALKSHQLGYVRVYVSECVCTQG